MLDVEALLAPVSIESPAGDDLAYDGERQLIEDAFERAGQGDTDVDWRDTLSRVERQAAQTRDVWLAVYLARVGARLGRLDVVEAGTALLAGLFERFWDSVHPRLDEYGLPGRKGPCESLTRIGEFLGPLRRTVLVEHPRLGRYTGADFERFAAEGDAAEGYGLFRAALADLPAEELRAAVARLDAIEGGLRRADGALTAHAAAAGGTGTNFQPAYDALAAIRHAVAPHAGIADAGPQAADAPADPSAAAAGAPAPAAGVPGRIDSREAVLKALDAVAEYYTRREPTSPIPVMLGRVKRWVAMDFLEILKDIAPGSVSDVSSVLMPRDEDGGGGGGISSSW